MSRTKKDRKKSKKSARKKKKKWLIPVICLVVLGLAAVVVYGLMGGSSSETATTITPRKEKPNFENLLGSWVRPDGGYVIEINRIHTDGKVDAAYFNPRPIHVSRSNVSEENGIIKLFVELQGQGYPGSTYTLKYNSESDVLVGIYFQAVIKQQFDVVFQRK